MPSLPVPLPFHPAAGDLPVKTTADVLAAYPEEVRRVPSEDAPVRDAIVEAQTTLFLEHQSASAYAAQQADPTRATGEYLEGHADDRTIKRQAAEDDEALRARMFATPDIVTPEAILAIVNTILAPFTAVECQYLESVGDRWFAQDGSATWHSFIGAGPDYPDRYYEQRPQSDPGGAWAFADSHGRYFVLRVPELDSLEGGHFFAFDGSVVPADIQNYEGAWFHDGTNTGGSEADGSVATFAGIGLGGALDVYQAIVNSVDAAHGQSVRWQLIADPNLV